ncbi:hypothetical protein FDA09_11820 [Clostridium botulinum]|nr:hypothetical protein [Clostridium botulinum]NFH80838.1 hypothetical protein [Clostridium botulinum]NFH83215.1 hypothetical protein [Clostridium botulinum]NFI12080.1 hypothetical protein [Clostridium botulinum]NFI15771.1 hypothetical protein [Clostridium botulinum]
MPYYPLEDEDKGHYEVNTIEEKLISEYTGYNFDRINELEIFEYWLLLRDAIIYRHMQTKEGNEYLENCWRIEQTKPDREGIRNKIKNS